MVAISFVVLAASACDVPRGAYLLSSDLVGHPYFPRLIMIRTHLDPKFIRLASLEWRTISGCGKLRSSLSYLLMIFTDQLAGGRGEVSAVQARARRGRRPDGEPCKFAYISGIADIQ